MTRRTSTAPEQPATARPLPARDHAGEATRMVEPLAYGLKDAAAAVGVSVPTLHRWIRAGMLRTTMVGGRRLVRRAELERMLEAGQTVAPKAA